MSASILGQMLAAGGHIVVSCAYCGRDLAKDLDHAGRPHAPQRKFCSPQCREDAARKRHAPRRAAVRQHRRRWAGLIHLHELEQAGQTTLVDEPLPPIPAVTV